ncbi:MAG: hypothetical protein ACRDUY_09685 [Nitriliruptorales bacterium]
MAAGDRGRPVRSYLDPRIEIYAPGGSKPYGSAADSTTAAAAARGVVGTRASDRLGLGRLPQQGQLLRREGYHFFLPGSSSPVFIESERNDGL